MAIRDYAQYDGIGLAGLVAKKKVKPIELLDEAIGRAEALNPKLNAVIYKDYERAREAAKGKLPKARSAACRSCSRTSSRWRKACRRARRRASCPAIPWPTDSYLTALPARRPHPVR